MIKKAMRSRVKAESKHPEEGLKMRDKQLQRILTSMSLVTQALGFALPGVFMTWEGGTDSGTRIGGIVAILTGALFLTVAITYWRHCHRFHPEPPAISIAERLRRCGWLGRLVAPGRREACRRIDRVAAFYIEPQTS
jgi:hypothetical protein